MLDDHLYANFTEICYAPRCRSYLYGVLHWERQHHNLWEWEFVPIPTKWIHSKGAYSFDVLIISGFQELLSCRGSLNKGKWKSLWNILHLRSESVSERSLLSTCSRLGDSLSFN